MQIQPTPANQNNPARKPAEDTQYLRRVLHELIDLGTNLARTIHASAKAQAEAAQPDNQSPAASARRAADVALALHRIADSNRRTSALIRFLDDPAPPSAASLAARHRTAARRRIVREVENAIQLHGDEEHLRHELLERWDGPDLDDDIGQHPVADIIADICRDLGVAAPPGTQPWKRRPRNGAF